MLAKNFSRVLTAYFGRSILIRFALRVATESWRSKLDCFVAFTLRVRGLLRHLALRFAQCKAPRKLVAIKELLPDNFPVFPFLHGHLGVISQSPVLMRIIVVPFNHCYSRPSGYLQWFCAPELNDRRKKLFFSFPVSVFSNCRRVFVFLHHHIVIIVRIKSI